MNEMKRSKNDAVPILPEGMETTELIFGEYQSEVVPHLVNPLPEIPSQADVDSPAAGKMLFASFTGLLSETPHAVPTSVVSTQKLFTQGTLVPVIEQLDGPTSDATLAGAFNASSEVPQNNR